VRAHHALFALKHVQRLRRWVFWPKRRDRSGRTVKRTLYTQLGGASSSFSGRSGGGSFEDFDAPRASNKAPTVVGGGGLDPKDLARAARYSATRGSGSSSPRSGNVKSSSNSSDARKASRPSVCCLARAVGAAAVVASERLCGLGQDRGGYGSAFDEDDDDDWDGDEDHELGLEFSGRPLHDSPSFDTVYFDTSFGGDGGEHAY
jgi:hypothetical protein